MASGLDGGSWSRWLLSMDCASSMLLETLIIDDVLLHVASIALLSVLGEGSLTCGSL